MRNYLHTLFSIFCLAIGAVYAGKPEVWRDPTVFRINKETAKAESILHGSRAEALKPLDLANPWSGSNYKSLNGTWDFNWYASVDAVPADWHKPASMVANWDSIKVPGTWQESGFDKLYYTNRVLPIQYEYPSGKERPEFAGGEKLENCKASGYVPDGAQTVGCYRKWVEISAQQLEGRVVLRVGSVSSGLQVYVNGEEVGYSQGSFTPAEFNITSYLKPGKNLIALKNYRWTDGSYMEVQDMIRFTGIYRDVFLRFEPLQRVRDISFMGSPAANLKDIPAIYGMDVANDSDKELCGAKLAFELLPDGSDQPVKQWSAAVPPVSAGGEVKVTGNLKLQDLALWSPDVPNLYTLLISLVDAKGQVISVNRIDTGFRRFESIEGNLYLNGKRFFVKGVNRHDHHPVHGRHVPLETMIQDIVLMKQNNINVVRTSHYPNDERFYYLCNRYGMALIDEANVECHTYKDVPGDRPQWFAQAVDRVENMVLRDRNHPSVLIWSLGNEQGIGWVKSFDLQYDRAKEIDPTRLVMCDRGNRKTKKGVLRRDRPDTITPMYKTLEKMEQYLNNREESDEKRPFFMCEYRHAMGESVGSLKEVWDMVYANEDKGLNGGCIWDWVDQGVQATDEKGRTYFQYGGDWGDSARTMKNFCLNGLVLADRQEPPKIKEVKKCYEPFHLKAVDLAKGVFTLRNLLNQTTMDPFQIRWEVREDGALVKSGMLDSQDVPAGETREIRIPYQPVSMAPGKEGYLRVVFLTKDDTKWAKAGHEVTFSEFQLGGEYKAALAEAPSTAPSVQDHNERIIVRTSNGVILSFDKATGLPSSLIVGGQELLAENKRGFLFDNSQALINNYASKGKNYLGKFGVLDLMNLSPQGTTEVDVGTEGSRVVVTIKNTFTSKEGVGYNEVQAWAIDDLGQIEVIEKVQPLKTKGVYIPRIGLRLPLNPKLGQVEFYGLGPHTNWPDRKYSSWTGVHASTVMAHYTPYADPQDCGNFEQVRWMSVSDGKGNGLRVIAPEPLPMSVLPYTQDELAAADHTIDLPETPTATELRVAGGVSGIGNASCGPGTEEVYRVYAKNMEYRFCLVPFSE